MVKLPIMLSKDKFGALFLLASREINKWEKSSTEWKKISTDPIERQAEFYVEFAKSYVKKDNDFKDVDINLYEKYVLTRLEKFGNKKLEKIKAAKDGK